MIEEKSASANEREREDIRAIFEDLVKIIKNVVVSTNEDESKLISRHECLGLLAIEMLRQTNFKVMLDCIKILGNFIALNEKFCSKTI